MNKKEYHVEAESTLKEKDLKPYWIPQLAEISSRLFAPTKTALQDLGLSLSSTSSLKPEERSWFSIERIVHPKRSLQEISFKSSMSSPVGCTGSEDMETRSRKIRIYPSKEQRRLFKCWFGASRFAYNKTVEYLRGPETKASFFTIKGSLLSDLPEWSNKTPYQIKSIAVRDACNSVKAAKQKFKATGVFSQVKFRSRKDPKQSCFIPKSAVLKSGVYPRISGEMYYSESLPDDICDSRLVLESGRYYLSVPYKLKSIQVAENQGRIVSIDPGVRTFLTYFSEGSHGKIGDKSFSRIQRLCSWLDNLISKMSKAGHSQRYRMKKAASRIRWKIRDLIDELHWKSIKFLTDNFDVILLPTFETKDMASKAKRKIRRKSVRSMLTFSHYSFKERLRSKCVSLGKVLIDCCEAYTSKTVSWTGEIVESLGGRKQIKSRLTGDVMDRDVNGARGILLRALVDQPSLFQ